LDKHKPVYSTNGRESSAIELTGKGIVVESKKVGVFAAIDRLDWRLPAGAADCRILFIADLSMVKRSNSRHHTDETSGLD
jgi:hypothetical protein